MSLAGSAHADEHAIDRAGQFGLDEGRDRPVEHDREARVLDPPAHDVQRIRPHPFARAGNRRDPAITCLHDRRGGAVAEDGGGDDRGRIVAVEADRDRASLDGDVKPALPRVRRGKARRGRQPVDPAGAAQAEDRYAADVGAQADRRAVAGVEAGRGNAGRRYGDDAVDVGWPQARTIDGCRRRLTKQRVACIQIEPVAFLPTMIAFVPERRRDDVALGNAGIVEHGRQPVEQLLAAAEQLR